MDIRYAVEGETRQHEEVCLDSGYSVTNYLDAFAQETPTCTIHTIDIPCTRYQAALYGLVGRYAPPASTKFILVN
jgi:hypothetical protein